MIIKKKFNNCTPDYVRNCLQFNNYINKVTLLDEKDFCYNLFGCIQTNRTVKLNTSALYEVGT